MATKARERQAEPPATRDIAALKKAAGSCTGCDLYINATQTVFGEGPVRAALMMIGEQPGDKEDVEGVLSWGRRVACWTGRWRQRESRATRST
jgi:uracil-DNA glycosylase